MKYFKSGIDSGGPYTVWNSPGQKSWWTVLDRDGKNVFKCETPGVVFTDKETAVKVCEKWNA